MLRNIGMLFLAFALGGTLRGTTLTAQGHGPKRYAVTTDRAIVITRDVLVRQGYEVIRIEDRGADRIIWYRRGNMGRGRGKGPPMKFIVRRVENRIVFVDAPSAILVDIDIRLRL